MRIWMLLAVCFTLGVAPAWSKTSLLYSANLPEITSAEGLAHLGALAAEAREAAGPDDALFFVFGGGSLGPSMLSGLDKGTHIIDILNLMDVDALQVSKREFIFQEDELSMRALEAFFPLVASNVRDVRNADPSGVTGVEPYLLLRKGEVTLGILALIGEELIHAYPSRFTRLEDPVATVKERVPQLRAQGADYVIVFTDFHWADGRRFLEEGLIDLLINNNNGEVDDRSIPLGHGLMIDLENRGRSALWVDFPEKAAGSSGSEEWNVTWLPFAAVQPAAAVQERMNSYLSQMDKILNSHVGTTSTAFDTFKQHVRSQENPFGNLVADAMRQAMNTDVAIINGGFIRGDRAYQAGDVLYLRDLRHELPFQDDIVRLLVPGEDLLAALENGLSQLQEQGGRFLHVSGMKVTYDPQKPVGSRIVQVMVGGSPLEKSTMYSLATRAYLARGGDEYQMLAQAEQIAAPALLIIDVVRNFIHEAPAGTVSPVVDFRFQPVN